MVVVGQLAMSQLGVAMEPLIILRQAGVVRARNIYISSSPRSSPATRDIDKVCAGLYVVSSWLTLPHTQRVLLHPFTMYNYSGRPSSILAFLRRIANKGQLPRDTIARQAMVDRRLVWAQAWDLQEWVSKCSLRELNTINTFVQKVLHQAALHLASQRPQVSTFKDLQRLVDRDHYLQTGPRPRICRTST